MSSGNPGNPQAGGMPAKKKTSPWLFVLIGCGGLVVIGCILALALGYFAFTKAKEAGLDPDLLKSNPVLAAAKLAAAANPDIEVVNVDEDSGKITFKDKKSGKTVTMNFEDVKQGRIVFEGDEGEVFSVEGSGEGGAGGFTMKTPEGSYQMGAAASSNLPGWLPAYPGTEPQGVMTGNTPEGRSGSTSMTTSDSVEEVLNFYQKALEDAGFTVNTMKQGGASSGGVVTGESSDGKRNAMVMIGTGDSGTTVSVNFSEKN